MASFLFSRDCYNVTTLSHAHTTELHDVYFRRRKTPPFLAVSYLTVTVFVLREDEDASESGIRLASLFCRRLVKVPDNARWISSNNDIIRNIFCYNRSRGNNNIIPYN